MKTQKQQQQQLAAAAAAAATKLIHQPINYNDLNESTARTHNAAYLPCFLAVSRILMEILLSIFLRFWPSIDSVIDWIFAPEEILIVFHGEVKWVTITARRTHTHHSHYISSASASVCIHHLNAVHLTASWLLTVDGISVRLTARLSLLSIRPLRLRFRWQRWLHCGRSWRTHIYQVICSIVRQFNLNKLSIN